MTRGGDGSDLYTEESHGGRVYTPEGEEGERGGRRALAVVSCLFDLGAVW